MALDMTALKRPIGPLPMWGWGALAAGGALLVLAARGHPAASAILNPAAAVPAPPGTDPAAAGPQPPISIPPGGTVYDPGTGTTTPPVSLVDLLGGQNLSDFIGKLGPDYQNFQLHDSGLGVEVQHSAQNLADEANTQNKYVYDATIGAQRVASEKNQLDSLNAGYQTWENAYVQNEKNQLDYLNAGYQTYSSTYAADVQAEMAAQTAQYQAWLTANTHGAH